MSEERRQELRMRLGSALIPKFSTDFNLDRWLLAYDNDIEACVEKFTEYLRNRRALGYDAPDAMEKFYARPEIQKLRHLFHLSDTDSTWINHDNGLIFSETGVANPSQVCKCIRVGEYARAFFGYAEYFQNLILAQEEKSDKRSFGICIFDMQQMGMLNFANPMAPINKMFESRIHIWMDYYGEMIKQVVIVNPPAILSVVFQVMKILLPAKVMGRFSFVRHLPHDIEQFISLDAIPTYYGGKKAIEIDETFLPNGCKKQDKLRDVVTGEVWTKHLPPTTPIPYETYYITAGASYLKEFPSLKAGQRLIYEYFANRDYEISLIQDEHRYLLPKLRMSTPLLSEEGAILIEQDGSGVLEIRNVSKMMKMKLKIAIHVL